MTITLTTKEDEYVLETVSKLKPHIADAFHLLVNGHTSKAISKDLNLPIHTIHSRMTKIKAHFNVGSTIELLALVIPAMIRKECDEFLEE